MIMSHKEKILRKLKSKAWFIQENGGGHIFYLDAYYSTFLEKRWDTKIQLIAENAENVLDTSYCLIAFKNRKNAVKYYKKVGFINNKVKIIYRKAKPNQFYLDEYI